MYYSCYYRTLVIRTIINFIVLKKVYFSHHNNNFTYCFVHLIRPLFKIEIALNDYRFEETTKIIVSNHKLTFLSFLPN